MALFGKTRDIQLFNSINTELINNIVTEQIGYYKVSLKATKVNMYGEAINKFLSDPILLNCLIERTAQNWDGDEFGTNVNRDIEFRFFKQQLVDANVVPEVGDYIFWYEGYYEVFSAIESQFFMGKDPSYSYSEGLDQYGSSMSIICQTRQIPADKLGLINQR